MNEPTLAVRPPSNTAVTGTVVPGAPAGASTVQGSQVPSLGATAVEPKHTSVTVVSSMLS